MTEPPTEPLTEPEPLPEIACENCVAACCKAPTFMMMSAEEHKRHSVTMDLGVIRNPAKFPQRVTLPAELLPDPVRVPARTGLYLLLSGCANLDDDNRCSIHSERPNCCRAFAINSVACRQARRRAGLDTDRPVSEDEVGPTKVPHLTPTLVQEFFPARTGDEPPMLAAAKSVEVGLFDLAQLRMSIDRDSRWIAERLAASEATLWSRRTRCAEWDIGALAAHLITGLRTADAVLRAAIEGHGATSPDEFDGDRAATIHAFGPEADAVCGLLGRITPAAVSGEVILDGTEALTVQDLVDALFVEFTVHGLDLADALGESRHLTPEAVETLARVMPTLLDPGKAPIAGTAYVLRSPEFEIPLTWEGNAWSGREAPDPCVIEGDAESVVLYALGRVQFKKSGLTSNYGDRARAFKRYLVGP